MSTPISAPILARATNGADPASFDDHALLMRLIWNHDREKIELQRLLRYYNGQQPLSYMHPELVQLIGDRVRQLVLNWPRLVVDALEERIDLQGFRLGGQSEMDDDLRAIFQYNDLDAGYQMAHVTAMIMRRAYAIVGPNPRDPKYPVVTVESPLATHVELDPQTNEVIAAVKRWQLNPSMGVSNVPVYFATLYRPNVTVYYVAFGSGWQELERREHRLGRTPVVPIVNRPQLWSPLGVSELDDIIPISDAACKVATDMMISGEFHAMPRRYALGFDEDDFTDKDGNELSTWQTVAGKIWSTVKTRNQDGAEVGQFAEADLRNFHETLRALAVQVGAVSGLPMHTLGYSSDNPASAEGINAAAERHIKRAERRSRGYEQGWEDTARLVLQVRDGMVPDAAHRMETMWADAATPTFAAKADSVVKLYAADRLVPRRQARKTLGYTDQQIKDMEVEDQADANRALSTPAELFGPKPDQPESSEASGQASGGETEQPARNNRRRRSGNG